MENTTLIEMIRKAGFSDYEAKCYLALLERDSLAVNEVAKLAGIPRPSAYDVLEKLMEKGVVSAIVGKTKRYSAADPKMLKEKALAAVRLERENIEKRKAEIVEREKDIHDNMDSVIGTLGLAYHRNKENGSPLEYLEFLKDSAQVQQKAIQLCLETKTEMLAFIRPPFAYVSAEQEQAQKDAQSKALNHGAKIRLIHEIPVDETQKIAFFDNILKYKAPKGYEPRMIENLPMKLAIYDEKIVLISLEDPIQGKPSITSLVATHHALAKGLKEMFESYWQKAQDYFVLDGHKYNIANPTGE